MRPILVIALALALAGCETAVRIGESGSISLSPTAPLNATIAPPAGDACVKVNERGRPRLTNRGACAGDDDGLIRGN